KLTDSYWAHVNQVLRVPGMDTASPAGTSATVNGGGPNIVDYLQAVGMGVVGQMAPGLLPFIPNPKNLTEAATNIGSAATSLAGSAIEVGHLAGLATKLFIPTNLLRGALFAGGVTFVLIGIWFLAKEVSDS